MDPSTDSCANIVQPRLSLGKRGEEIAVAYLKQHGYTIRDRNWRAGKVGEIDIVATVADPQTGQNLLVFIEVKTRSSLNFGNPIESVTPSKQQKLVVLADHYLQHHGLHSASSCPLSEAIRFDVLCVQFDCRSPQPDIMHVVNAFDAS